MPRNDTASLPSILFASNGPATASSPSGAPACWKCSASCLISVGVTSQSSKALNLSRALNAPTACDTDKSMLPPAEPGFKFASSEQLKLPLSVAASRPLELVLELFSTRMSADSSSFAVWPFFRLVSVTLTLVSPATSLRPLAAFVICRRVALLNVSFPRSICSGLEAPIVVTGFFSAAGFACNAFKIGPKLLLPSGF